jgi:tRNA A-37 threonylcarbamoyl transferase component Bud32
MRAELPPTEVLLADQRRRWDRGERVPVEHFVAQRPGLRDQTEVLLDLIYGEVILRREAGERPEIAEYLARFPTLADPIRVQFEVDQVLEVGPTRAGHGMQSGSTDPTGGPPGPRPPAPPGYEIVSELGRGGMGVVYLARQIGLDRLVALKMIRAGELADPAERARFETEARAASRLSHPNVVQVYDVGEHAGRPYLALEHVPGGTLADVLRGPPLAPRIAAELAATLARAVEHAHSQGVVHRDLKPANILLGNDECRMTNDDKGPISTFVIRHSSFQPKIADFGLAKRLGADSLTQTGDFVGTPSYAAPEQAAGREVGPAADVWALGAILYQMLTGRPPFAGDSAVEILDQVRFTDPVAPSRLRPHVPRDLETICLTCLRKDPARRYESAAALADDLDRFRNGEPIRARPVGVAEHVAKWCRRRPALAGTIAALVVLAAASLITVTALWQRAARARDAEGEARQKEATALANERAERERTAARGAELLIANARYAWLTDDLDAARQALAEVPPTYRGPDWAYLNRAVSAGRQIGEPTGISLDAVAVSPDGARIVGGYATERLRLWDATTGAVLLDARLVNQTNYSVEFTADGRVVAVGAFAGLHDGKRTDFGQVAVTGPAIARYKVAWTVPERPRVFLVAPGGTRAAFLNVNSKTAVVRDTVSGRPLHQFESPAGGMMVRLAFSPTGRYLLTAALARDLALWDLDTGGLVRRFECPESFFGFNAVAVTADGQQAAVTGGTGSKATADLVLLQAHREPRRIDTQFPVVVGCAFSPDGRRFLAFGGGDSAVRVWDVASAREEIVLRGIPSSVRSAAFAPDGRRVVAGYKDGRLVVWDVGE